MKLILMARQILAILLLLSARNLLAQEAGAQDQFYEYAEVIAVSPYYVMDQGVQDCYIPEHATNEPPNTNYIYPKKTNPNLYARKCSDDERRSARSLTVPIQKGYRLTVRFLEKTFETVVPEKIPVGARIKIAVNIAIIAPISYKR